MALPRELVSVQMAQSAPIKERILTLHPANSTANVTYSGSQNNRIVFNVPAYENCFLSNKRTYLSFRGKVASTALIETETACFKDGVPVFERLVVRAGNGTLLEDIRDYHIIERIMSNFEDYSKKWSTANEVGDYRALTSQAANKLAVKNKLFGYDASGPSSGVYQKSAVSEAGVQAKTYRKPLLSGIFGQEQDTAVPIGLMSGSGGFAFSIELYLNKDEDVCESWTIATSTLNTATKPTYTLNEVKLHIHLLEVDEGMFRAMNKELMSNNFRLPYKRLDVHRFYLASGKRHRLNIHENAKDLSAVYVAFRKQSNDGSLEFVGGAHNTDNQVEKYQFRYAQRMYPNEPIEMILDTTSLKPEDSIPAMSHILSSFDMLEKKRPFLTYMDLADGGKMRYDDPDFIIAQSFKETSDPFVYNGVNTMSSGAPLELDVTFCSDPNGNTLEAYAFTCEHQTMIISQGGVVSLLM